ncbi:MAG: hypothetical protein H7A43_03300 [Verrucomicrobia bacterium]|nr:hypothetical protein [Kiritimatiellia bacterium]MCP5487652.1 hypothetical protein [Verrucomicrobiota bacterium]
MKNTTLIVSFLATIAAMTVWATPPNVPVLDGRATEYDDVDLVSSFTGAVSDPLNVEPWGPDNALTNLYVTWDESNLYVAVNAYVSTSDVPNKVAIMLDVDPEAGTGATTTTNWLTGPGYITYNDVAWSAYVGGTPFGLDYIIASEGSSHNLIRVLYDGIMDPDTNNVISVVDTYEGISATGVVLAASIAKTTPAYPLNAVESKIPFDILFSANTSRFGTVEAGEVVPRGLTIRLFANMHNNLPADLYSSPMVIPPQESVNASWSAGFLISDDYVDVVIDADSNGLPDVAVGDVNAPWIKALIGAAGQSQAFAQFNEEVTEESVTNAASWMVDGVAPTSVTVLQGDLVRLDLANPLPASGNFIIISSDEVEDAASNSKFSYNFLNPVADGMQTSVTVRFVLETASGMGASPGASNFYINGSNFPLEWEFPPAKSSPLSPLSGSLYYRDVTFLPGSSTQLFYKYSAELSSGSGAGTNNYEAIRLNDFANASRTLVLPTDGSMLVVTDYLGAAAAPLRDQNNFDDYSSLYYDARRGDAGVRQRAEVLFRVDMSGRNLAGVTRVILMGSDPLRGFNNAADFAPADWSDYPPNDVSWSEAGLEMYDDGTHGDEVLGDGIYSREWAFTTSGTDSTLVLGSPNSLVGGENGTSPYFGSWYDLRSPRSFDYKFAIYKSGTDTALLSPEGANLTYYLGETETNVIMNIHEWSNNDLPLPPPSNAPTMLGLEFSNGTATVVFDNEPGELDHGVEVAFDLVNDGWRDHGLRGVATDGLWKAYMPGVSTTNINFQAYSGPAPERTTTWWTPNPVPATGATVQVWFSQIGRENRGIPQVFFHGSLTADGSIDENNWFSRPMTFLGNGLWTVSMDVAALTNGTKDQIRFGFRNELNGNWDGNYWPGGSENYRMIVGSRATWTPENPGAGDLLTVTYDATGGVLEGGTNVYIHSGYNKYEGTDWVVAYETPMTNTGGETWTTTVQMPTNGFKTFNMLFRNLGDTTTWDSEYDPLHWVVFPGE